MQSDRAGIAANDRLTCRANGFGHFRETWLMQQDPETEGQKWGNANAGAADDPCPPQKGWAGSPHTSFRPGTRGRRRRDTDHVRPLHARRW